MQLKKEDLVAVLDTQVNKDNILTDSLNLIGIINLLKNLDAGYKGETNEEIVDAWFKTIVSQMLDEEGYDPADARAGL